MIPSYIIILEDAIELMITINVERFFIIIRRSKRRIKKLVENTKNNKKIHMNFLIIFSSSLKALTFFLYP